KSQAQCMPAYVNANGNGRSWQPSRSVPDATPPPTSRLSALSHCTSKAPLCTSILAPLRNISPLAAPSTFLSAARLGCSSLPCSLHLHEIDHRERERERERDWL
ncbi:hypothetical protein GOP47_0026000, partial [Adiantum capillus-veneris]